MMENIKGLQISKLDFTPVLLGDLINYEGPIVSHFTDADNPNEHYIYKWADSDTLYNRWLIAKVTEESLSNFFLNRMSLRQLLIQKSFAYLLDVDDNLGEKNVFIVNRTEIPENYLPSDDSYFDEKYYEEYALQLKMRILNVSNSLVVEHLLNKFLTIQDEMLSLQKQQFETNNLLNVLINQNKKGISSQI